MELGNAEGAERAEVLQPEANAEEALSGFRSEHSDWAQGETLVLGDIRWKPDLASADGQAVLHFHQADYLRPYVIERMRAAAEAGIQVCLAAPLQSLYDEGMLREIVGLDPQVYVLDGARPKRLPRLLACLADEGIQVSPDARRELANTGLEVCQREGSADQRGRRLEALLAFLLSQVDDFVVVERNFRTSTEEIDIVVQQRATEGRAWATLGAPFMFVEAKNRQEPISQEQVSAFHTKMLLKRGSVRLGLMYGANGFSSDAEIQELKLALGELTIVLIHPDELQTWMDDSSGDDALETLVRRAMLR